MAGDAAGAGGDGSRLSDYDYDLPEDQIALRPVRPRPAARMLVVRPDSLTDSGVAALPDWLAPGDLLVLNDTRVIPARLRGRRLRPGGTGAEVEVTLVALAGGGRWRALARPAKRLAPGDSLDFAAGLTAAVLARDGAEVELAFPVEGAALDAALSAAGEMPLPPYIAARRAPDAADRDDYQTVFASRPGAVAAPTASLHFDDGMLAAIAARGIATARVTLHVGAGTFLPVKAEDVSAHRMHAEWGEIGPAAAEQVRATIAAGGRVVPVGTTALRVLETAATGPGTIAPWRGETDIFLRPGHRFAVTGGLMTNFHLPRSTLLMLVSALMGLDRMRSAYAHAIAGGYRFFSYGDASLLLPDLPGAALAPGPGGS